MGNLSRVGVGGLITDSSGAWVRGYARDIGITASVVVELQELRDGIRLCLSLNLLVVEFELDEMLVVDFMSQAYDPTNANDAIVADCMKDLKTFPQLKFGIAIEKLTSVLMHLQNVM